MCCYYVKNYYSYNILMIIYHICKLESWRQKVWDVLCEPSKLTLAQLIPKRLLNPTHISPVSTSDSHFSHLYKYNVRYYYLNDTHHVHEKRRRNNKKIKNKNNTDIYILFLGNWSRASEMWPTWTLASVRLIFIARSSLVNTSG